MLSALQALENLLSQTWCLQLPTPNLHQLCSGLEKKPEQGLGAVRTHINQPQIRWLGHVVTHIRQFGFHWIAEMKSIHSPG